MLSHRVYSHCDNDENEELYNAELICDYNDKSYHYIANDFTYETFVFHYDMKPEYLCQCIDYCIENKHYMIDENYGDIVITFEHSSMIDFKASYRLKQKSN